VAKIVLVADDDPYIRTMLCRLFERESDYGLCEQAKNGEEAVEIATRCKPDLIILDFSMPVMSGIQAAKKIKSLMPSAPIILLTTHDAMIFASLNDSGHLIDRVVGKAEMSRLLSHVRELAPV
jgi:YesN/AraC family two-component response regulator